jgi:hypothetical protein
MSSRASVECFGVVIERGIAMGHVVPLGEYFSLEDISPDVIAVVLVGIICHVLSNSEAFSRIEQISM